MFGTVPSIEESQIQVEGLNRGPDVFPKDVFQSHNFRIRSNEIRDVFHGSCFWWVFTLASQRCLLQGPWESYPEIPMKSPRIADLKGLTNRP